jgi:malonyl CoA-acyl carrier protein transacylase
MSDGSGGAGPPGVAFPGQVTDRRPVDEVLTAHAGHPLVKRLLRDVLGVDDPRRADFADTRAAQPMTYVAGLLSAARAAGPHPPPVVLGHSLGEITALAHSGAIGTEEGLGLVAELGRIGERQFRERPSALLAVMGLPADRVELVRRTAVGAVGGALDPSGFNGPRQVVLSGDRETARSAGRIARGMGATVHELAIRGGYHSPLMAGLLPRWRAAVHALTWAPPRIPVLSTVDARVRTAPDGLPELLVDWLVLPVRWVDAMAAADGMGVSALRDAGPGRVLRKLGRRIGAPRFVDTAEEALR